MDTARFSETGYDIVRADNPGKLVELREEIVRKARELVGDETGDSEAFLNNFHHLELRESSLNEKRMELIKYCTEHLDAGRKVFDAFSESLTQLLGPDIVIQKTTNLVIQQPGDPDRIPTHRDSPLNSPFEIVVWLPLVDVYDTKSMYVLNRDRSQVALNMLKEPESGFHEFSSLPSQEGDALEVSFGQACFFWPGLVHAVDINEEQETRWALNIRYKNLFAPSGAKGQAEFFDLLSLSPLARMALEYEKEAYR